MSYKKGPWTKLKSKNIYKNPWMEVVEDSVVRPDGKNGIFGIVNMKSGVTILPIDNEGNIFLIEQYRYTLNKKTIEAISGGIEKKENILAAAKRELKEETGIEAKKWIKFGVVNPFTTIVNSPNYLFLAKDLTFSKSNPEVTENIKLIKVSLNQAVDWVMKGSITSAIASTIILKLKEL